MCWRISSSKPPPQSRSPPSKLTSAAYACAAMGLVAHCRRAVGQEFHQLRAADDGGARDQIALVELAALEARRAHEDRATGFGEVVHQFLERRESLFVDVV